MASDRSHDAVQDVEGATHITVNIVNAVINELDSVFNFSQLEGKDAGQQVRQFYSRNMLSCAP